MLSNTTNKLKLFSNKSSQAKALSKSLSKPLFTHSLKGYQKLPQPICTASEDILYQTTATQKKSQKKPLASQYVYVTGASFETNTIKEDFQKLFYAVLLTLVFAFETDPAYSMSKLSKRKKKISTVTENM